eukprot:918474-Lingulodinium_polyedra.AAC.1
MSSRTCWRTSGPFGVSPRRKRSRARQAAPQGISCSLRGQSVAGAAVVMAVPGPSAGSTGVAG